MARMQSLKRGDVVWVNLDPTVGGEIQKRRPCVVVSLSVLNERRLTVVVVPLSTGSTPRPPLVVAVPSAGAGSNARIDQIRAVDKSRIPAVVAIGNVLAQQQQIFGSSAISCCG